MGTEGFDPFVICQPPLRSNELATMTSEKENDCVVPLNVLVFDKELVELSYYLLSSRFFICEEHYLRQRHAEHVGQKFDESFPVVFASGQVTELFGLEFIFVDSNDESKYAWCLRCLEMGTSWELSVILISEYGCCE